MPTPPDPTARPRARTPWWGALLLLLSSLGLCVLALEGAFRIAPALLLPAGAYGHGVLNDTIGMNVHGGPVLYTKAGFVRRVPNREGFLDVEHERARPAGVTRIGVFGDSYVESMQVPLESAFFRQAQALSGPSLEWLAFGMSGWGTLQEYRVWQAMAERYDLGVAVYVFVENDPGDNDAEIKTHALEGSRTLQVAELAPDGTTYVTRPMRPEGVTPIWYEPVKWVQRHSLLANVIVDRVVVLRRAGVQVRVRDDARGMTGKAEGVPSMNDLPSSWPADARERVGRLTGLILRDWKRSASERKADLLVLYVPRGEEQLRGTLAVSDTWLPWLTATCRDLDLPLVDPTQALRAAIDRGEAVYGDHWTAAGHRVVAEVLADALRVRLRTTYK